MSDQTKAPGTTPNPKIFYVLCALLILSFLWRAFVPANEYPGRTAQMLEMGVDALCIAGLIGMRKVNPTWFWIALVCGIGLFAIRLHSDASWWTGHWHYSLSR
ncbi:MAG: hypothetical protein WC670_13495 [Pseudolabrys sp.]|jgi:hypothetical protein